MPTLRDESVRRGLAARLEHVTPETKARWGSLDAPRMICHLSDSLDSGLGVFPVTVAGPWVLRHFPVKQLALYVVPFPKGAKGPRELFVATPGDFETDRRGVVERMERMAAVPSGQGPPHPLFGPVNNEEWNALHWKHMDHHLRQFGC